MSAFDITLLFNNLLENIFILSFDEIKNTNSYLTICLLIENNSSFSISIYRDKLYFDNINDLVYGTLNYCIEHGFEEEVQRITKAIEKIKLFVDTEEMIENMEIFFV